MLRSRDGCSVEWDDDAVGLRRSRLNCRTVNSKAGGLGKGDVWGRKLIVMYRDVSQNTLKIYEA